MGEFVVYKYQILWKEISSRGEVEIEMPCNSTILHVGTQEGRPCIWARIEKSSATRMIKFLILATGQKYDRLGEDCEAIHVGTIFTDPALVFHVFEVVT